MNIPKKFLLIELTILILITYSDSHIVWAGERIGHAKVNGVPVEYIEGELSVHLRHGASEAAARSASSKVGGKIKADRWNHGWATVELPTGFDNFSALEYLKKEKAFDVVELSQVSHGLSNDAYYGLQWGLGEINASQAWDITCGSSSDTVSIIDSGVPLNGSGALSHVDLSGTRFILGSDFTGEGIGVKDSLGHGTHVLGIAGATANNDSGIAGVANASSFLVVKILNGQNSSSDPKIRDGVFYAVDHGAKVINLSVGRAGE